MYMYMYRILSSKRPWALEIDGPKNGGGRLHRQAICMYNAREQPVSRISITMQKPVLPVKQDGHRPRKRIVEVAIPILRHRVTSHIRRMEEQSLAIKFSLSVQHMIAIQLVTSAEI